MTIFLMNRRPRLMINPITAAPTGGGNGITDHGALTGLGDDDHTQYLTDARGDARYETLGTASATVGTHSGLTDGVHGISAFAATILDDTTAAAVRTTLGLGSAAVANTTDFDSSGAASAAVGTHSALTTGVHGISAFAATILDDTTAAAVRTTLGLGSAAVANTTDFDSSGAASAAVGTHSALTTGVHGISAFAATILDDTTAAAVRTTLGLGSAAVANTTDFDSSITAALNDDQVYSGTASTTTLTITIPSTGRWFLYSQSSFFASVSQTFTSKLEMVTAVISGATNDAVGIGIAGTATAVCVITTGSPTVVGGRASAGTQTAQFVVWVLDVTTAGTIDFKVAPNNGGGTPTCRKGSFIKGIKLS